MVKYRLRKKYVVLLICLSVLALSFFITRISFALFTTRVTPDDYVITVGNLQIDYTKTGNLINLTGTYPLTNFEGLATPGYTFDITNNGSIDGRYQIRLELDENNTIPLEYIKFAYIRTKINSTETDEEISPILLSELDETQTIVSNQLIEASKTDSYVLKMWIDYSAPNTMQGKNFKAKIVVDSVQDKK